MSDLNLSLNWDLDDGNIVFYVNAGETVVGSLVVDAQAIYESYDNDVFEANQPTDLADWDEFVGNMADVCKQLRSDLGGYINES